MECLLVLTNFYISISQNDSQATVSNYHFIQCLLSQANKITAIKLLLLQPRWETLY